MIKNKVWLLLMLPLMMELLVSCCDCQEPVISDYTHCSLEISNLDNSGEIPVATDETSLSKNAYGIRISVLQSEEECHLPQQNWSFFSSAYAFSCDCPPEMEFHPLERINSISIHTINDFDDTNSAGSDITEFFSHYNGVSFTPIGEVFDNYDQVLYYEVPFSLDLDLLLMTPPSAGVEQQYMVNVELTDGRVFELTTSVLQLN